MNGNCNIRVEKLLDLLEEIVNEKVWKTIINTERPNANNYQHRLIVKEHKKAEEMQNQVEILDCGSFKVQSATDNDKYYIVSANEICDEDCRAGYCYKCKICLHLNKCICPENCIKLVVCKHIHAVCLFEKRSEPVLNTAIQHENKDQLFICEPSTSQMTYQADVAHFIEELSTNQEVNKCMNLNARNDNVGSNIHENANITEQNTTATLMEKMSIKIQELLTAKIKTLELPEMYELYDVINTFHSDGISSANTGEVCKKRKIEKQSYFPKKK